MNFPWKTFCVEQFKFQVSPQFSTTTAQGSDVSGKARAIDGVVCGSNPPSASLSLRVRRVASTRCGHIERKDLETARYAKRDSSVENWNSRC